MRYFEKGTKQGGITLPETVVMTELEYKVTTVIATIIVLSPFIGILAVIIILIVLAALTP